jgi:hypothetical protein
MAAPEGRMSRMTAFLQSGTGLITAVATLIAAIVGLVTLVTQLTGGDGGEKFSSDSGGAPTLVNNDTPAQRELRARIPATIQPTCGAPKDPEENAVAAFNCTYREIVNLQYNLFASSADLQQGIASVKDRYGSDSHECGTKPLLCFVRDGTASIIWTEGSDILSFAWRDDGNLDALYESWNNAIVR